MHWIDILRNLERFLSDDAGISPSITELNRRYVDYITVMLAAMQEAHKVRCSLVCYAYSNGLPESRLIGTGIVYTVLL